MKAVQADDGIYHISDSKSAASARISKAERKIVSAMTAIARNHVDDVASPVPESVPESESEAINRVDDHLTPLGADSGESTSSNSDVAFNNSRPVSEQEMSASTLELG